MNHKNKKQLLDSILQGYRTRQENTTQGVFGHISSVVAITETLQYITKYIYAECDTNTNIEEEGLWGCTNLNQFRPCLLRIRCASDIGSIQIRSTFLRGTNIEWDPKLFVFTWDRIQLNSLKILRCVTLFISFLIVLFEMSTNSFQFSQVTSYRIGSQLSR